MVPSRIHSRQITDPALQLCTAVKIHFVCKTFPQIGCLWSESLVDAMITQKYVEFFFHLYFFTHFYSIFTNLKNDHKQIY